MNRFGLTRDIPEGIRRAVRQRDGFGCIVCGNAIIDYEHFEPEFADAEQHTVDGIILLCITCHGMKTRGRLSKETITKFRSNPTAKLQRFSAGPFDIGDAPPSVIFGNISTRNVKDIIRIDGDSILSVKEPEQPGGPFRISANIRNRDGQPMLSIVDNEWRTSTSNWDVVVEGRNIVIRSALRDINMSLRTDPPNQLTFERFQIMHKGIRIDCAEGRETTIMMPQSNKLVTSGIDLVDCQAGVVLDHGSMMIGLGCGSMHVKEMVINPETKHQPRTPTTDATIIKFPPR